MDQKINTLVGAAYIGCLFTGIAGLMAALSPFLIGEFIESDVLKFDAALQLIRRVFLCPCNAPLERINRRDVRCPVGIAPRESSIATTNFQYTPTVEVRQSKQGARFVVFGIDSDCHTVYLSNYKYRRTRAQY